MFLYTWHIQFLVILSFPSYAIIHQSQDFIKRKVDVFEKILSLYFCRNEKIWGIHIHVYHTTRNQYMHDKKIQKANEQPFYCFSSFQLHRRQFCNISILATKYREASSRKWCNVHFHWSSTCSLSSAIGWNVVVC